MILSKYIEVLINSHSISHYNKNGYKNILCGEKIIVPISFFKSKSKIKIRVKCDVCGKEKEIGYYNYTNNTGSTGIYCCSQKCSRGKAMTTCVKKYGVKNVSQNPDVKTKKAETTFSNYGVNHPLQNKEIKQKVIDSNIKKYNCKYSFQNEDVKQKIKETNLQKYGVENFSQTKEFGEICKKSSIEKYGTENPLQNGKVKEKCKETNIVKYGVEYPTQNKIIRDKVKKTTLKNYGVEYNMQNEAVFIKSQKAAFKLKLHEQTGLYYRGTYEKHFLDFCFKNNIPVKKGKTIKYLFEDKTKTYFSDFYLEEKNLIIEIKSNYIYKKHLDKNLAKERSCIEQGYEFIFLINKNYSEFLKTIL